MSFKFISKVRKSGDKKVIYVPKENIDEVKLNKDVLVKEINLDNIEND